MRRYKYLLRWIASTRRSHENKRNNEEDLRYAQNTFMRLS